MTRSQSTADQADRELLARWLPVPAARELPDDRRALLADSIASHVRHTPSTGSWAVSRRVRLAAAGAVLTAAAAVTGLALVVGGADPAYAVERTPTGVRITVHDASRLTGLSGELTALGYPARLVPISGSCREPRPAALPAGLAIYVDSLGPDSASISLVGGRLPAGDTVTLGVDRTGGRILIDGEVSARARTCFPAP